MNRSDLPFTRAEFARMPFVNLLLCWILADYTELSPPGRLRARRVLQALDVFARLLRTARQLRAICMMKPMPREMPDEPAQTPIR
jgi:hypothetical protein